MSTAHWLCKSEPATYSFEQLLKDKKTHWDGVRNYQARNFLRQMKVGDLVLIYHSGDVKAVVGVAEVTRSAFPDLDADGGDWSQVDLKSIAPLKKPVALAEIKASKKLAAMPLIRHTRLSVMPVSALEFQSILTLGGLKA